MKIANIAVIAVFEPNEIALKSISKSPLCEPYTTTAARENGIEAVKSVAPAAPIEDLT